MLHILVPHVGKSESWTIGSVFINSASRILHTLSYPGTIDARQVLETRQTPALFNVWQEMSANDPKQYFGSTDMLSTSFVYGQFRTGCLVHGTSNDVVL